MTAMAMFIYALYSTLSSRTFIFGVNREKLIFILSRLHATKISFSRFTPKIKVIELRFVHSTNINLHIAVNLHPSGSLYNPQKPRYTNSENLSILERCETVFRK